jgi:hypothetical protein
MAVVFDQAEVGDTDALMPEERSHPLLKFVFTSLFSALASVGFLYVTLWWPRQEWRSVQTLRSSDRQHIAHLERLDGRMEVQFRVSLDGEVLHDSWGCTPNEKLPFRETLAWDSSDKLLVLELANEIVFAYDVTTQTEIHPSRFDEITVPTITLSDIGFEGRDELELEKKLGVEPVAVP